MESSFIFSPVLKPDKLEEAFQKENLGIFHFIDKHRLNQEAIIQYRIIEKNIMGQTMIGIYHFCYQYQSSHRQIENLAFSCSFFSYDTVTSNRYKIIAPLNSTTPLFPIY